MFPEDRIHKAACRIFSKRYVGLPNSQALSVVGRGWLPCSGVFCNTVMKLRAIRLTWKMLGIYDIQLWLTDYPSIACF